MKNVLIFILFTFTSFYGQQPVKSELMEFSDYLKKFDYQERKEMKIDIARLLPLLKEGKAELIDIRFPEEVEAWSVSFSKSIPLNELPNRLSELDRNKLIVTVYPHSDRAAIARHYLKLNGFRSKYLVEGLLGLAEYLRGDKAESFIKNNK